MNLCVPVCLLLSAAGAASGAGDKDNWQPCGWGGGGFYYSAVFQPNRDGVIYMGGDVAGVYKSEDHGRNWRLVNNGLAAYGVFSLAVDRKSPDTVYAATEEGLCKSTDGALHWKLLPHTDRKDLRITGEKGHSIRSIAVDPGDGNIIYAGNPLGKIYKSSDGGETWKAVYQKKAGEGAETGMRVQLGKVNGAYFGGFWEALSFPSELKPENCMGLGFSFKSEGAQPKTCFVILKTSSGVIYRSKNLSEYLGSQEPQDLVLKGSDFTIDPEYASKNADAAKAANVPDWPTVERYDFTCSGALPDEATIIRFMKVAFVSKAPADGQNASEDKPLFVGGKEFTPGSTAQTYGNTRIGKSSAGPVFSVAVSSKNPSIVAGATADSGLVLSLDGGETWKELETPKKASSVAFDPNDENTIYGTFFTDGVWKSADKGATWSKISGGFPGNFSVTEVAVSPANSLNVYAIGTVGWNGGFYFSNDGGKSWKSSSSLAVDPIGRSGDPTQQGRGAAAAPLSIPTNIAINPINPKELFISSNWRPCLSADGGLTWAERDSGADISVVTDIRFSGARTYVSAMDEGTFASDNGGEQWKQLWPSKYEPDFTGHNWRIAVSNSGGTDKLIGTCSPWDTKYVNRVVVSNDSGKTFKVTTEGLPTYLPKANTMWGTGYARALAVDPRNPKVAYLGIDGDPEGGKNGGGIFKSEDGGLTWKQLSNQPGSRRMYYGLMVDPTNSNRIFWGACGSNGGLYRSDDGGNTWKQVFKQEQWIFNVLVAQDGTVYCPGNNLWRSTDHGETWTCLTQFHDGRTICGLEVNPTNPKMLWISAVTWSGACNGAVYKTTDGGATWQDITGNIQYIKPQILRFNPVTKELWAGGTTLNKLKQ